MGDPNRQKILDSKYSVCIILDPWRQKEKNGHDLNLWLDSVSCYTGTLHWTTAMLSITHYRKTVMTSTYVRRWLDSVSCYTGTLHWTTAMLSITHYRKTVMTSTYVRRWLDSVSCYTGTLRWTTTMLSITHYSVARTVTSHYTTIDVWHN